MNFFCCSIPRVGGGPPCPPPWTRACAVGCGVSAVSCKMLPLILGTEIPSTLIRSTTAKIVRIVKNDAKLRGCNKDEYLREIFKLSKNIDLGNSATSTGSSNNTVDNHSVLILCNASTQTSCRCLKNWH